MRARLTLLALSLAVLLAPLNPVPAFASPTVHDHTWVWESPHWDGGTWDYFFVVEIGIHHYYDPAAIPQDAWAPWFEIDCAKENAAGDVLNNPCNIDVSAFSALGFSGVVSEPPHIYGTANPADKNCVLSTGYSGTKRDASPTWQYVMAYLAYIQVRFLNNLSDCNSLHLSNTYRSGGGRTDIWDSPEPFDYEESYHDNARTGLFVT